MACISTPLIYDLALRETEFSEELSLGISIEAIDEGLDAVSIRLADTTSSTRTIKNSDDNGFSRSERLSTALDRTMRDTSDLSDVIDREFFLFNESFDTLVGFFLDASLHFSSEIVSKADATGFDFSFVFNFVHD